MQTYICHFGPLVQAAFLLINLAFNLERAPFDPHKANLAHPLDRPKLDFTLYNYCSKTRLTLLAILENTFQFHRNVYFDTL